MHVCFVSANDVELEVPSSEVSLVGLGSVGHTEDPISLGTFPDQVREGLIRDKRTRKWCLSGRDTGRGVGRIIKTGLHKVVTIPTGSIDQRYRGSVWMKEANDEIPCVGVLDIDSCDTDVVYRARISHRDLVFHLAGVWNLLFS